MHWFRRQIRHGSLLALFALAINLVLSFGHVHAPAGKHSDAGQFALSTVAPTGGGGPSQDGDRGHPDDFCPICMAAAAMGNALTSTPPALPVQFAISSIEHSVAPQVALVEPGHRAFYSRGPPLS